MSDVLMKSVSGIRGIVGRGMDIGLINQTAGAMASFTKKGKIVVGRDSRPTGAAISMNLISALNLMGCDVIDLGIVPTPTVQIMVEELKAHAGIIVSASHNPVEWNAFKLVNSSGTFFSPSEVNRFFKLMEKFYKTDTWDKVGSCVFNTDSASVHIDKILSLVDVKRIKKCKFKVALDSVNGAGSLITQTLLEKLGCFVVPINCVPDGIFPRGAEPLPENLHLLSEVVKKEKAHIGFAQDPDADRLAIVDETGSPLGEEYTVTLAVDHILARKKGSVIANMSTTKAVELVSEKHGVPFKRSKVGEINVVELMKKESAVIGGEGNGGVISPDVHYGRDSLVGIAYILEMMAERRLSVSGLKKSMPEFYMKKGKVTLGKGVSETAILEKIMGLYKSESLSRADGLRIDFINDQNYKGSWVHLRSSNTEPIFRIIAESDAQDKTEKIFIEFQKLIKK